MVRRLPAVETLGSTSIICADKTGTLTENQMTVRTIWTPGGQFEATGSGYTPSGSLWEADGVLASTDSNEALRWSLLAGAACNDAAVIEQDGKWDIVGDPTEGALLVVANKTGLDSARVSELLPRLATIPFSSERQYMATLHLDGASGYVVLAKGGVERILDLCGAQLDSSGALQPLDREYVLAAAEDLADQGLRVLATAMRPGSRPDRFDDSGLPGTLTLTGLQAMLDPARAAAAAAVAACHTAGIAVKMITGDHASTAMAIARDVGLLDGLVGPDRGLVLTGTELAALPAEEFPDAVEHATVCPGVPRAEAPARGGSAVPRPRGRHDR